jgi:predicted O-methyltransferase YrrM
MAYSPFQLAPKYIRYWLTASNGKGHGIHSPFIYDLVRNVINDNSPYPAYRPIESLRHELEHHNEYIVTEDFGAGTSRKEGQDRRISSIARHALKPRKFGQLFFRLAQYYRPDSILELGTSLGVTTAYLASGHPSARVITLEGAPAIAHIARQNFNRLHLDRIQLIEGNFDQTLDTVVLRGLSSLDLVYVDGNHRLEPTTRYFNQMKPLLQSHSILLFDDIHWSREMENAWSILRNDPAVTCSFFSEKNSKFPAILRYDSERTVRRPVSGTDSLGVKKRYKPLIFIGQIVGIAFDDSYLC